MAFQDMISYINNEVYKEIDDQINRAKIDATHILIEYGEQLEREQEERLYQIKQELQKQETMLKSEQDYLTIHQSLQLENEFAEELINEIEEALLEYIVTNREQYQKIIESWLTKACSSLDVQEVDIFVSENDSAFYQKFTELSGTILNFHILSTIKAGLLIQTKTGIEIDLRFSTLFQEKKQDILSIAMHILKENR